MFEQICRTLPLLSADEARQVVTQSFQFEYQQARRYDASGQLIVDRVFRICETQHHFAGDPLWQYLAPRIWAKRDLLLALYDVDLHPTIEQAVPLININRYDGESEVKGMVGFHADTGDLPSTMDRKLSVSILLSDTDDYNGGELMLYDAPELCYPLRGCPVGTAAIFPGVHQHAVTPVTRGRRYSAVIWLRGPRFR